MSNAAEILVIVLATVLAILLVLSIVLTVLLIKITKQIKQVTTTAQNAVENVNQFAMNVTRFSSPAIIGSFIMDQIKKYRK